ncbi:hypothetical protein [Roseicyclus elongatus]|nr:hypothetical protein [Roseibacterium elongatum]
MIAAGVLMEQGRAASHAWLPDGAWAMLPWETSPDELRARINQSYLMVLRDLQPR